jgi:hypothetical protein
MSNIEAFSAIGQFCYRFCDLALGRKDKLLEIGGSSCDLAANMDKFEAGQGGVWCGGAANMCAQMLNASGRVDKAWYYADGIPQLKHAMTLAMIDGVLYHFDPSFNGEFLDAQDRTMPFLDVLRAIKARTPPRWRQHYAEKTIHARHLAGLQRWSAIEIDPCRIVAAPDDSGVTGRGVVTASVFRVRHNRMALIDQALIALGYPAEPAGELWHYLRLHPTTVENVDYGDPDTTRDEVLRAIQSVVAP